MDEDLREFRSAYFDVIVEEQEPCKPKESVLPANSRWVPYNPSARSGPAANGSAAGSKSSSAKKGKVRRGS